MPIAWNESEPSDSSAANLGATEFRSLKSTLATALGVSLYWPGSGGASAASAGILKPGAVRALYGTQSQVSASADGALMVTSDTTRLYAVNSASTPYLGSGSLVEDATSPALNSRWVMAQGSAINTEHTLYGVVYGATPTVILSLKSFNASLGTVGTVQLTSYDSSGFTADVYRMNNSNLTYGDNTWRVQWISLGTVGF